MAPFYSTLSIWIGGIVLVAMLKVTVSKKRLDGLKNVKLHQMYLGRYLIFLIVGLLQSSLICLGGSVLSWYSVQTSVFVCAGGMDLKYRVCKYYLYAYGFFRGYR